jgi:hypothetical protein
MRNRALLMGLVLVFMAGCTVKEEQEADGDRGIEINPAPVEIQTDTKSVVVPDVNIGNDTTARDTTPR